jgi:putative FmdB family regulatory protein
MPIYVYRCATCGEIFEEIQRVGDGVPKQATDCPRGGTACALERQMTAAGHRFKAELSSDGVGGYVRQADGQTMVRQRPGKSGENYGSDRSGRS